MFSKKRLLYSFLCVCCFLLFTRLSGQDSAPTAAFSASSLDVSVAETQQAGASFPIEISPLTEGEPLDVLVETNYGTYQFTEHPTSSPHTVTIPAFSVPASGTILVSASQRNRVGFASTTITPDIAVDPIPVYLGSRTVVADAQHVVMQVAVPQDRWGNPVTAGTEVAYTVTRSDQTVETYANQTEALLSWVEVFSGTVAGRTRVAAASGVATAPERDFLEVAGVPVPYEIEVLDPLLPADGQSLIRIRTGVLADEFDNIMPDGLAVHLDVSGVTGRRRLFSQTVKGTAEFVLQVPSKPGDVSLQATASGVQSQSLELVFGSAVQSITATISDTLDSKRTVTVGPIVSVRNAFVPDGAEVKIFLRNGSTLTAETTKGYAVFSLADSVDVSSFEVTVLGSRETVIPS